MKKIGLLLIFILAISFLISALVQKRENDLSQDTSALNVRAFDTLDLTQEDSFDVLMMSVKEGIKYSDAASSIYDPIYAQKLLELKIIEGSDIGSPDVSECIQDVDKILKYTEEYNEAIVSKYNPDILKKAANSVKKYCSMNIVNIYKELHNYKKIESNIDILKYFYLSYAVYIQSIYFENEDEKINHDSHFIFKTIREKLNDSYVDIWPNTL